MNAAFDLRLEAGGAAGSHGGWPADADDQPPRHDGDVVPLTSELARGVVDAGHDLEALRLAGPEPDPLSSRELPGDLPFDAKGRHATTSRALVRTLAGGWIIDTPGRRSLALTDVSDGIAAVFEDIEDLTEGCRFSDCAHESEPGCAITAALQAGDLDADRVKRWRKLKAEEMHNSETLAQSRARQKGFGKMVKGAMAHKRSERGR